jgi:membrane protease YdiL (CAAX protease family)
MNDKSPNSFDDFGSNDDRAKEHSATPKERDNASYSADVPPQEYSSEHQSYPSSSKPSIESSSEPSIESSTPVFATNAAALPSDNYDRILSKEERVTNRVQHFAHAKYGLAAVFCIYLMYQFAGGALHSALRSVQSNAVAAVLQGIGQSLFMLLPTLYVMRYSPLKTEGLMRLRGSVTWMQWAVGLLGIFGVQIFDAGFLVVQERLMSSTFQPLYQQLHHWSDLVDQAYRDFFAGTTALQAFRALIIGAVIPAFAEEMLFRGLLQRSLEQAYSARRAIVITAIIFGALHFNPLSLVPLVAIGMYLGFLAYYTQSLALPIVAHFLSNAIAIVALYAPQQDAAISQESISLVQAFLLAFVGIVILGGAFITILRHTPQVFSLQHEEVSGREEKNTD